jgi:hypothetical protein
LGAPFYYVAYYWLAGLQHLVGFFSGHSSLIVTDNYLSYPLSRGAGLAAAIVAGGVLLVTTAAIAWRWVRSERADTCYAGLLAIISFIIAVTGLTALGRAHYGFDFALQERYTTGTLVAWQALMILIFARLNGRRLLQTLSVLSVFIPIALLPNQLKAVLKPTIQDQMLRAKYSEALKTGQSDAVKRLREMGMIQLGQ